MNEFISRDSVERMAAAKKKRIMLGSVVFCSLIIAVGILSWNGGLIQFRTYQPTKVSNNFMHSILANETDKAYALTSVNFQDNNPKDKFKRQFDALKSTKAKVSFKNKEVNGDVSAIAGTIKGPGANGQEIVMLSVIELVKEDGRWAVDSILIQ